MALDGKVVLVTGGGTGMGAAVARQFAQAGAQVIIMGRRADSLVSTSVAINAALPVHTAVADVADRVRVKEVVDQVLIEFGRIDILVNNAGVNIAARRMEELAPEDWDLLMDVNATGVFNMIHAVLPQMRTRQSGLIITICSISGVRPSVLAGAAYSASKHASYALTKVVSQEEERHGIRACVISPGDVNTPLLDKRPNPVSNEQRARMLQPDDIAATALFLATLPPHVCIPELVINPVGQVFV